MGNIFLSMLCVFILSGCASTGKKAVSAEQLEMRVADLEKKVEQKDQEIAGLSDQLDATSGSGKMALARKIDFSKVTKKDIQSALKNAGFYNGPVDGKFGQLTTAAVKEFQKANGLKEDGVVGQQTWAKLSEHLE